MPLVRRRVALSVLVIVAFAIGAFAPIVNAAYVTTVEISNSQSLQPDENGHTYMYMNSFTELYTNEWLVHSEDISVTDYSYSDSGWDVSSSSFVGPASRMSWFFPGSVAYRGWLHDGAMLPAFYDFANSTNDYDLEIEQRKVIFGVPIGEQCSLVYDAGLVYYGVFNVTDQEFFHLTVTSRQDDSMFEIVVLDEMGRAQGMTYLEGGDVTVLPFAPDGPGMYSIFVVGEVGHAGVCVLEFLLESITPEVLTFGTIVEGVLPGSEFIVQSDGGDIVYNEKAPTVHTYKLAVNSTTLGLASYSMNYPELDDDIYEPFEPYVIYTSDSVYYNDGFEIKVGDMFSGPGDEYFYKPFSNESYYVSFVGMEDVSYTLLNTLYDVSPLPVNHPFFIEDIGAYEARRAYTLSLGSDSILKLNTTDAAAYSWFCYSVNDEGILHSTGITDAASFHAAPHYYLPAGEYIFMATCDSGYGNAHFQFTIGPIIDGAGGVAVDTGSVVGVRIPTSALTLYQGNVSLLTHDNVTVSQDIDYLNKWGYREALFDTTLGNRQNGLGWVSYGGNFTTMNFGHPSNYDMFHDGFVIVVLSPYQVLNNTGGSGGNEYFDYTVDYSVTFNDWAPNLFNGTLSRAISSSAVWANQTLGYPDAGTEYYRFALTCPEGTWMNVSWWSEDIDTINNIWIYQNVNGYTSRLDYTDLAETQTGDDQEGSFQFGCTGNAIIIFDLDRLSVDEGSLDVLFTPFLTDYFNMSIPLVYVSPSGTTGGGTPAAIDPLLVAGGVGAVAVVVVVVLVVLKKQGKF